jgi:hypothetical protein
VSTPEVGSGKVSIFPTFKGFRKATSAEVDGATKEASSRFTKGFSNAGTSAGKGFASGFKASTKDVSSATLTKATADVARASRELSAARLKELDATGKVRVAEAQLADTLRRYSSDSAQAVRAEERLATAQRHSVAAAGNTERATERLTDARRGLASASAQAASSGSGGAWYGAGGDSANRFFSGFGSTMLSVFGGALGANLVTGIGYTIGRGIGNGVRSGFDYAFGGISLASELEQSVGAVTSVFKDDSELIIGYAKDAANAVGLSRSSYQKFATVVGAQLKNLGVRVDDVAPKTNDLITLGADLAAQFGGSTSDAVAALSSLLRGERDPIERYGVSLKQVDINARLASWGMSDLTGEAEKQATIQATLSLLWEQTADAQGTFNRESDTFAHKQQVANALLEETQTRLGEMLLPGATSALSFATDRLLPALENVIERVGPRLAEALADSAPGLERLSESAADLLEDVAAAAADGGIQRGVDLINDLVDAGQGMFDAWKWMNDDPFWENFLPGSNIDNVKDIFGAVEDFFGGSDGEGGVLTTDFLEKWEESGAGAGDAFSSGLLSTKDDANSSGAEVSEAAQDGFLTDDFLLLGSDAGDGFAKGLSGKKKAVGFAAKGLADEAAKTIRDAMKIASPSRVTREQGQFTGQGFALGLLDQQRAVSDAASRVASAATLGVTPSASSGSTAGRGSASDRPIYADGIGLIGWVRQQANGEARLVFADLDRSAQLDTRLG